MRLHNKSPLPTPPLTKQVVAKFEARFAKRGEDDCWEWGIKGGIGIAGKRYTPSRISYAIYKGEVPRHLDVCHTCDNPKCVNPNHLFLGTHLDNMRDCKAKGRNHIQRNPGETNPKAKLTEEKVKEIRRRYKRVSKNVSNGRQLAIEFGVSKKMITYIAAGKFWKHIQ